MKVHYGLENFPRQNNAIVTSGTFDGVHLGHRRILARLKEVAKESDGTSVVITYWPHPRMVVANDSADLKLLSTLEEKIALLTESGIDHLLVMSFQRDFSMMNANDFVEKILINGIGTKKMVIGYDHRFGKNREGGIDFLITQQQKWNIKVEEIHKQEIDNLTISSTFIRNCLLVGDVSTAASRLGQKYALSGIVVKGRQLGRTLGYPTANLELHEAYKLVPADGVYAVQVIWRNQVFGGMLSVGTNPTVDGKIRTIEVNIFEFNQEIYGEKLTLIFVEWLRGQVKFASIPELVLQISQDKIASLGVLNRLS